MLYYCSYTSVDVSLSEAVKQRGLSKSSHLSFGN